MSRISSANPVTLRQRVRGLPLVRGMVNRRHNRRARRHLVRGAHTYANPRLLIYPGDTAVVRLGAFISVAEEVIFMPGGNHPLDWVTTYPLRENFELPGANRSGSPRSKGDIVVGHDVWIGHGALILSGMTIANGAVVRARSV